MGNWAARGQLVGHDASLSHEEMSFGLLAFWVACCGWPPSPIQHRTQLAILFGLESDQPRVSCDINIEYVPTLNHFIHSIYTHPTDLLYLGPLNFKGGRTHEQGLPG